MININNKPLGKFMKGVYCPHCNADLEINAKVGETVKCIDCERPLIITNQLIKEYHKANPTLLNKLASNTLKMIGGIVGLLILVFAAVFFQVNVLKSSSSTPQATNTVTTQKTHEQDIQDRAYRVADKYLRQYEMAKVQGDKAQICAQAGLVSAAFLNAQDKEQYNRWKSIEIQKCEDAGITR